MRVALAALCLVACTDPAPAPSAPPEDPGHALLVHFECQRCHALEDVEPPEAHADCVGCHRDIADGTFDAPTDALDDWRPHVAPLSRVPSLRGVGRRLRRGWVEQFILHPHDLRPALVPTMPRLDLQPDDAARIAQYLVPEPPSEIARAEADVERGRALYHEHRCARCHAFSGSGEPPGGEPLAPDLRFTRDRMPPGAVVQQIFGWPDAPEVEHTMPAFDLPLEDARALAAFVLRAPLVPPAPVEVPARLPVLDRPVAFAEVEARVFRRLCWHCHSDPDFALGDGGPGNHGGFGFAPRRIDLSSYAGVLAGGRDADGAPVSIFRPGADGTPRIVETLLARQREEAGEEVPGVRGMPLGYPALSPEDIQLVETWIAQGRPM